MTPRRIPSSASPDPRVLQGIDETWADLIRENEALKQEIKRLRAGEPGCTSTDSRTAAGERE